MISASIFVIHAVFAVILFIRGRRISPSDGWLGLSLVLLIFAIGWTLATLVTGIVWPERGIGLLIDDWNDTPVKRFLYREITGDTISLLLLAAGEIVFYVWYFRKGSGARPDVKAPTTGA